MKIFLSGGWVEIIFFKRADEIFSPGGGERGIFQTRERDFLVRGLRRNDFKNNSSIKKMVLIQKKVSCKRENIRF